MLEGKALYRCDGCELELFLLAPVERPCPNCGGDFRVAGGENHPMEASNEMPTRVSKLEIARKRQIDDIVKREAPIMINELEEFVTRLRREAVQNGKEEGSDN